MPSGTQARGGSSSAVRSRGSFRGTRAAPKGTGSTRVEYEILPAYTSTPLPVRLREKPRRSEGGKVATARPLSYSGESLNLFTVTPRQQTAVDDHGYLGDYGSHRYPAHRGNQREAVAVMEPYQPGLRGFSLPPEPRITTPTAVAVTPYTNPSRYNTYPTYHGQDNNNISRYTTGSNSVYRDPVTELLHAVHSPDLIYPSEGSIYFKKDQNPQPFIQEKPYSNIPDNLCTDENDNLIYPIHEGSSPYPYTGGNNSFPSPGSNGSSPNLFQSSQLYRRPQNDCTYPGVHFNAGPSPFYADPHKSASYPINPHEIYAGLNSHSGESQPSTRAYEPQHSPGSQSRRKDGQPCLPDFDRCASQQTFYRQLNPRTRDASREKDLPSSTHTFEYYPCTDQLSSQPGRRAYVSHPSQERNSHSLYSHIQHPRALGTDTHPNSPDHNYYPSPQVHNPYPSLKSLRAYQSPQAQFVNEGHLVDESLIEETQDKGGPNDSNHRFRYRFYHSRIFPHYTDLVMVPYKGNDRSIVRIERLTQGDVNYRAAHFVAEGPFKGIVINKAASGRTFSFKHFSIQGKSYMSQFNDPDIKYGFSETKSGISLTDSNT